MITDPNAAVQGVTQSIEQVQDRPTTLCACACHIPYGLHNRRWAAAPPCMVCRMATNIEIVHVQTPAGVITLVSTLRC